MATSDQSLDEIVTNSKPTSKEEWFGSLKKAKEDWKKKQALRRQHKIQRVAKVLREKNNNCFEPIAVSIGPYHRNNKDLKPMQKLKAPMLVQYVEAQNCPMEELYNEIEKVAAKARECYAEDATEGMSDEDFTRMMFLDGCFFLQFIMCDGRGIQMTRSDRFCVRRDLYLLENQLPFIVLKALSGSSNPVEKMMNFIDKWPHPQLKEEQPSGMMDFICHLWSYLHWKKEQSNAEREKEQSKTEPIHLLQLLRQSLLNPEDLQGKQSGGGHVPRSSSNDGDGGVLPVPRAAFPPISHSVSNDGNGGVRPIPSPTFPDKRSGIVCASAFDTGRDGSAAYGYAGAAYGGDYGGDYGGGFGGGYGFSDFGFGSYGGDGGEGRRGLHTYRSATALKKVGIHFRKSQSHRFTDVGFRKNLGLLRIQGELRLPPMYVDDYTKSRLLNLVAYEMCADVAEECADVAEECADVTSYLCFLNELVDSAEDVMELRSIGILINHLASDKQLADLFNEIGDGLVANANVYAGVNDQIEKHYKNKFIPWSRMSFVGALVILVLTFLQTFYTIKQSKV